MPRTENDTWDLASGVGATATLVAAARAVATRAADPVIDDPFAEPLVSAVGIDFFTRLATGELSPADLDDGDSPVGMGRFADGMAARTRFFDDFLADAVRAGIRQAVILASGLDARAYRLAWPDDMVVFEIDQPEVLAFKADTLAGLAARPAADLRVVAVDLRRDWPAALTATGFDPARPTAWIAEGLLGYLPADAQDGLFDRITALSAAGSRVAVEAVPAPPGDDDEIRERMRANAEKWRGHGFDIDFSELIFLGERADPAEYLSGLGWRPHTARTGELLTRYGLAAPADGDRFDNIYLSAER